MGDEMRTAQRIILLLPPWDLISMAGNWVRTRCRRREM